MSLQQKNLNALLYSNLCRVKKQESFFFALLFGMLILSAVSCSNDPEEVRKMTQRDTMPEQQASDVIMYYSEYGDVIFELHSPRIETYRGEENPRTIFPEGFEVVFYDSTGKTVQSRLTANYGIKMEKELKMIARGDVVVNNYEKKERLNTEELIWDQRHDKIYTDKFVTITTENQVL
ncbi:MAG TPA: LPS export ABC transporter periplasmic protein LptC, partial [Bacteroidales bacterium]|nr:LPS export ABC transporter periplasmic protein LptC [Bacteroidales bacterium]